MDEMHKVMTILLNVIQIRFIPRNKTTMHTLQISQMIDKLNVSDIVEYASENTIYDISSNLTTNSRVFV